MIYETQVVEMFRVAFWFACLWLLCFWLLRRYRVDAFRYKLFVIRDSLFDAALEGSVPFNHPAYSMMRQYMNGLIRFAYRLNTTTLLFFLLISLLSPKKRITPDFSTKLYEACKTLPTDTAREKVFSIHAHVLYYVFTHITYTSPVFFPVFTTMTIFMLEELITSDNV